MGSGNFVPEEFDVPKRFDGPGFRLEPLAPAHNERDHEAWMSSIDHIRRTPGMNWREWPHPMTLEENMEDMEMHYGEFLNRKAFAYSILDGDEVIGCVYIDPGAEEGVDAHVRSWVTEGRAEMDRIVWTNLSGWLDEEWPFQTFVYDSRDATS